MYSTMVWWTLLAMLYIYVTPIASNPPMYIGISAKRNKTGYWIAQFDMDHSLSVDWDILERFEIDVKIDIKPCKNGEIFQFTFDIKAPRQPAIRNNFPVFKLAPRLDAAYSASDSISAWHEASRICRRERSHLAVVSSMDVAAKLGSELSAERAAFVGIRYDNGTFVDPFGSPVDVDPWMIQKPHQNMTEACYVLDRSLMLFPEPCDTEKQFICERSFA